MTVSKITSPITPNELIDKTNEIIDNLGSGGAITVDNTLSTTSTNPVQNKVITEALDAKQDNLTAGTDLEIVGYALTTVSGNGSVSLNNAIADGLISVTLTGGCEQNGTPTPTNPVDIICNNGALTWDSTTQQITVTGITETIKDSLNNTATAQNLLSISDAEDSSIIYKDEQDILTGNITRRVGFYALTGEETFYYLSSEHLFYSSNALRDENPLGAVNCLCNYYRGKKTSKNRQPGDCYILTSGRLDFLDDRFNSTVSFKSWLAERYAAGDPVIVVFPLETPTTETVQSQVLNTTEGINTLSIVQSSIPNLGMEVNYNERNKHIINFTNESGYTSNTGTVTSVNNIEPVNGNVTLTIPDTSNLANKDLSNLSSTGEKHFLNKNQVSNCILEAPNGVLTYSGNTITLKAGLKVLVPDGRNSDGTLKSIEVTIPNDITGTIKSYQANRRNQPLFIDSEGNFHYDDTQSDGYYITDFSSNGTYDVDYSPKTNTTKRTNGTAGSWTTVKYAYIGRVTIDSNSNVTYASIEQPINLFTNTDKKYIASLPMPSGWSIDLTLGASGTTYTAPGNGWVSIAKVAQGIGQYIEMNINNQIRSTVISPVSTGFGLKTFIPVKHGQQFTINYNASGNLEMFKFTYAGGEV